MTGPTDAIIMLYQAGMISRKHVEDTLGITALQGPRATTMQWIGDCWVVFFDDAISIDDIYLEWLHENVAGWFKKDPDGRSWCFDSKADASLFLLRFK